MAINTTRLSTGLGLIFGAANEINTWRGTTLVTRLQTTIYGQLASTPSLLTGIFDATSSAQGAEDGYMSYLKTLAQNLVIAEVNLDLNIPSDDLVSALTEWKRQMLVAADSFATRTTTAIGPTAVGSPAGSSYAFATSLYDGTGQTQDMILVDKFLIQTSADKDHGGTRWAETMSVVARQAANQPTDYTFGTNTYGSGVNTTITVHDPASGSGTVQDPGFDDWSTNTPNKWTLGPSTLAGTHVFRGSDDPRDGATGNCLRLLGDGTVIPKLRQRVDGSVVANGVYAYHFRLKKVADPGTDWGVTLRLVDSTGAALTGPNSYSNSAASSAATSVAADWTNVVKGFFILPNNLPADGIVYLEIVFSQSGSVTTAPVNTAEVYVDHVDLVAGQQLYNGGPWFNVFSGIANSINLDAWTYTLTGSVLGVMVIWMDRMFGLRDLGIRMPTSGSPTQADALIT